MDKLSEYLFGIGFFLGAICGMFGMQMAIAFKTIWVPFIGLCLAIVVILIAHVIRDSQEKVPIQ
jgi:uncharacterized membrane protein YoaK (UPF0700 family)